MKNAILLSNTFEATLTIVSVFEPYTNTSPRLNIDQEATNRELEKQYRMEMQSFLEDFDLTGINHEVKILAGVPHEKILNVIKAQNINLLIMGTNGRSAFSRIILGSVTEKVIRTLPCAFLTTKTQDIFKLRFDNEIKEIETHFANGNKLFKSGLLKEAVEQYLICLQINDMHVPSIYKLAELYKNLGDEQKAEYYEKMAKDLLRRLWDNKIENEIRKHYKKSN